MRVYIVLMGSGTIYSVRKSKTDAKKDKAQLESRYENAMIKEFNVQ